MDEEVKTKSWSEASNCQIQAQISKKKITNSNSSFVLVHWQEHNFRVTKKEKGGEGGSFHKLMTCVLREERLECVLQPSIEGILILSQSSCTVNCGAYSSNCFRRCYTHFTRINLLKDNEKYCHILNLKCFSLFAVLIFYKSDMDGYSRWQQKT